MLVWRLQVNYTYIHMNSMYELYSMSGLIIWFDIQHFSDQKYAKVKYLPKECGGRDETGSKCV